MTLADVIALAALVALIAYAVTGGADFGGGVWDLLATGRRAKAQRRLIEQAIAPIWEANHVWLILVVVMLFGAFPRAYAAIGSALHIPLTIVLLGIVFRGSAFVFRQYGGGGDVAQRRWGTVFAVASVVTPVFLGVCLGAITEGIPLAGRYHPAEGFVAPWAKAYPFAVGGLTLALFAFLAAVYATNEPGAAIDSESIALRRDFRARALVALGVVVVFAVLAAVALPDGARFRTRLLGAWWILAGAGVSAAAAATLLTLSQYAAARVAAVALAVSLVGGWGWAQAPYLVAPDVTIAGAAAPRATLVLLAISLAAGAAIIVPSLYLLLRAFKGRSTPPGR